jgi:peptidoglycan/LPS O-acetylase OafA/YrhL
MAPKRFHGLDGLRGVCALSVVLFHAANLLRPGSLMPHGYLAVDMFFILSGFVIALNYETALEKGLKLGSFLQARGVRLLPVYWLGALFNIAVFVWMASSGYYPPGYSSFMIWLGVPLLTLLLLPVFGTPGDGFSPAMLNVTWSLLVEWLINGVYAARLFRWRTSTLALIAAALWLAMAVAGYFTGRGWCVGISRYDVFTLGLLRGIPAFLAGVVIFRLHTTNWFAKLPVIAPEILLTLWLCIAVVPTVTATPTFDAAAVILVCPLLVMLLIRADRRTPAYCKTLGALSYPLYTVHPGIILLAQGTPLFGLNRGPEPVRALLVLGLCLAAAWLISSLTSLRRPPVAVTTSA